MKERKQEINYNCDIYSPSLSPPEGDIMFPAIKIVVISSGLCMICTNSRELYASSFDLHYLSAALLFQECRYIVVQSKF